MSGQSKVRVAAIAVAFLTISACVSSGSQPPVQEMSDARQALAAAAAADARRYSSEDFQRASQLLSDAEASLGRGAFASARRFAIDARSAAMRAREAAVIHRPGRPVTERLP